MRQSKSERHAGRWTMSVPTIMTTTSRPRVDERAHHTLTMLAIYADNDGSNITVSVDTLASNLRVTPKVCRVVLDRLEELGLIIPATGRMGLPGWRLAMTDFSGEPDPLDTRQRRYLDAHAARNRQYRKNLQGGVASPVMPKQTITGDATTDHHGKTSVMPNEGARDGVTDHHVMPKQGVRDGISTIISAGESVVPPLTSITYLHKTSTEREEQRPGHAPDGALFDSPGPAEKPTPKTRKGKARDDYTAEFEAFWSEFPLKKDKRKAAVAWHKATASGIEPEVIRQGAIRYAADCVAVGREPKFIKHGEGWIGDRRWEDEIPHHQPTGPFRSPTPEQYQKPSIFRRNTA